MAKHTQTVEESILRSMRARRGSVAFAIKDFEAFGHAAAVRQALSRLARAGTIRRIRQGLYDIPREHPVIGKTAPDPMATVRTFTAQTLGYPSAVVERDF